MKEDLSWRSIETGLGDLRRGLNSLNSDTDFFHFYLCLHNFVYNANVSLSLNLLWNHTNYAVLIPISYSENGQCAYAGYRKCHTLRSTKGYISTKMFLNARRAEHWWSFSYSMISRTKKYGYNGHSPRYVLCPILPGDQNRGSVCKYINILYSSSLYEKIQGLYPQRTTVKTTQNSKNMTI